ncbi:hypothetical protein EVAR_103961_1 [Eumeta japonica]|uniref:Uncharacterized protein n=1 Tax=Eumeta variegata TaxID=151549 RepID=A0A4C1YGB3_EUMVA|nr:hypothetical protein EVAR_103961_1 [Eumeta japonica]
MEEEADCWRRKRTVGGGVDHRNAHSMDKATAEASSFTSLLHTCIKETVAGDVRHTSSMSRSAGRHASPTRDTSTRHLRRNLIFGARGRPSSGSARSPARAVASYAHKLLVSSEISGSKSKLRPGLEIGSEIDRSKTGNSFYFYVGTADYTDTLPNGMGRNIYWAS